MGASRDKEREFVFRTGPAGQRMFDDALKKLTEQDAESLFKELADEAARLKVKHPRRKLK